MGCARFGGKSSSATPQAGSQVKGYSMTTYLVCEGADDAELLKRVLPEQLLSHIEVIPAGGLYAIKSLARSLIVRRQAPVVIVIDADVITPEQVEERRKDTEEILESVAANTPVKVILAIPTIEIVFFQDISLLSHLLGYMPSQDMIDLAIYQPRKALAQLITQSQKCQSQSQLIGQLTPQDLEALRKNSVFQELIQFLQSVRETAAA
jgi:hypothetical protein